MARAHVLSCISNAPVLRTELRHSTRTVEGKQPSPSPSPNHGAGGGGGGGSNGVASLRSSVIQSKDCSLKSASAALAVGAGTGVKSKPAAADRKSSSCLRLIRCAADSSNVPAAASVSGAAENKLSNLQTWDPDISSRGRSRSAAIGSGSGVEFKLSDFELCSHVSVGLAGRGDEVLFEGVVRNPESPLKGMRVVLRQLASRRAQLWGQRALQVLSRLVPRENLHLSYATRVHGYIRESAGPDESATLTLVHGYNGSYSLHQWLHLEDWLTGLETTLSLNEEGARRIGDDRTGGPAITRQLRLVRTLMRDLLIGVNYLHSRGYAHTQLRLQNLQVSEADRRVKVGLLGNAAAFPSDTDRSESSSSSSVRRGSSNAKPSDTRQLMIAYDIWCVGYIMAKMILRELMDPAIFSVFKSFIAQGNDPAGLREMFISLVKRGSYSDNPGIQLLDRDGGAGWSLLACMLAIKPSDRISCKDALRHPFLCGPMWPVAPSVEGTRWSLGSTTIRIVEEYIYGLQQRNKLLKLVDTLERMNPNKTTEGWAKLVSGRWRLLYYTGREIGLTIRKASPAVMIKSVTLTFSISSDIKRILSMVAEVKFTAMRTADNWPHNKAGVGGKVRIISPIVSLSNGERLYAENANAAAAAAAAPDENINTAIKNWEKQLQQRPEARLEKRSSSRKSQKRPRQLLLPADEPGPSSVPIVRISSAAELEFEMELDQNVSDRFPQRTLMEVRRQIPKEMFDINGLVCGTYVDSRLMVLRGITGSACLFTRSPSF